MKKTLILIATLMLAVVQLNAQEEPYNYSSMTAVTIGKEAMILAEWHYPDDIQNVVVNGSARLAWVTDTANYIEFFRMWEQDNDNRYPDLDGNTLTMRPSSRTIYLLHTTRHSLNIHCVDDAVAARFDDAETLDKCAKAIKSMAMGWSKLETPTFAKMFFRTGFKQDIKQMIYSIVTADAATKNMEEILRENAPSDNKAPTLAGYADNAMLHHYELPMSKPVLDILVDGNCIVMVVDDDEYFVESLHTDNTHDPASYIALNGQKLRINDPDGGIYYVHTPSNKVVNLSMVAGCNSFLAVPGRIVSWGDTLGAHDGGGISDQYLQESVAQYLDNVELGADWHKLINDNQEHIRSVWDMPKKQQNQHMSETPKKKHSKDYDRTDFDFHWGFNNWGTSPVNGLVGMSDPGYDLRTSFSSYQLSYNYRVLMTDHFALMIGVGYESDVYKFNKPYVDYTSGAFAAIDTNGANGYFSTRFVTRYVQLPIGVAYSAKANRKGYNLKLSAIPALGWCGKHTGLKHELHQKGSNPQDHTNLKEALNPYKLDVRLDMDFGGSLGVFLQVATLPVFVEGTKIYPIKIGFKL